MISEKGIDKISEVYSCWCFSELFVAFLLYVLVYPTILFFAEG